MAMFLVLAGGTLTSGGLEGFAATGTDFYFNSQLIASDLMMTGDIISFGLRYYDTSNYQSYGAIVNARLPITSALGSIPGYWWIIVGRITATTA